MITTKYYEFLLEKQLSNLILEGNMVYSAEFYSILGEIKKEHRYSTYYSMATDITNMTSKNVNINDNYIDISDNPQMIKFTPDDKADKSTITYRLDVRKTLGTLNPENDIIKGLYGNNTYNINPNLTQIDFETEYKLVGGRLKHDNYQHLDFYLIEEVKNENNKALIYCSTDSICLIPSKVVSNKTGQVRLGRFLNKFYTAIGKYYSAKDIEEFVNLYQSIVMFKKNAFDSFKIVEGEDIRFWYNEDNYYNEDGQLGESCMRHDTCQDFFDIYVENPNVCKMIIFLSESQKLMGRALLWTLEDGSKYMDRVYTCKDSYMSLFKKYADDNRFSTEKSKELKVKVITKEYIKYPYMDTFEYYKPDEGILSNRKNKPCYQLDRTTGGFSNYT